MKNKFKRITAGLIVGVLGSLMLSTLVNAKVTPPFTPFPPLPTYKRLIIKPYISKVTLQRTGQPDITRWATMSQGCNSNYITANSNWAPLIPNAGDYLSNGYNPVFLITKSSSDASTTPADYLQCKVLIPDNADYATYVQGTTQYKFEVSAPGPVTPSTPGVSAVFDNTVNGKVVNPTTGNINPQEVERNAAEYNFKKYEAKAIDQVNTSEISGGGMAAGIVAPRDGNSGLATGIVTNEDAQNGVAHAAAAATSGINEASRPPRNTARWNAKLLKGV